MDLLQKYWRWLALIVLVIVLTNSRTLPWPLVTLLLGAAAVYLLREGWIVWRRAGGPPTRGKVTYWRGQRIEVGPPRVGPALPDIRSIGPALIYLVPGIILLLVVLAMVLRAFGW
jgi:hypothetical protein